MTGYVIDTNVIIRYLTQDHEELYQKSKGIFEKIKKNKITALLTEAVVAEVIFVLDSVYEVPKNEIADSMLLLTNDYPGIKVEEYLISAILLFKAASLSIVDCIIIAKSRSIKLEPLSFDKKLLNNFYSTYK